MPDFDIKIACSNGFIHWQILFSDQISNNYSDTDLAFICSVARELKSSIETIKRNYFNKGVNDNVR